MRRQQAGILALLEEADNMSPAVHRGYGQRRGQGLIVVRGEDDDAAGADNPGALQISRGGKAEGPYITDPLVAMRELIPRKKDALLRGRRVGHQLVDHPRRANRTIANEKPEGRREGKRGCKKS